MNPHKSLFVPLDFSVLYVRDLERLRRVFTLVPEYLRGDTVEAQKNYMDYGIQLGRRFRALKAWVIFRSFGRDGMAARLREHIRLANRFADWIRNDDRFELAAPVSMGVVCFGFIGAAKDKLDKLNSEIVERINASARGRDLAGRSHRAAARPGASGARAVAGAALDLRGAAAQVPRAARGVAGFLPGGGRRSAFAQGVGDHPRNSQRAES